MCLYQPLCRIIPGRSSTFQCYDKARNPIGQVRLLLQTVAEGVTRLRLYLDIWKNRCRIPATHQYHRGKDKVILSSEYLYHCEAIVAGSILGCVSVQFDQPAIFAYEDNLSCTSASTNYTLSLPERRIFPAIYENVALLGGNLADSTEIGF